MSCSKCLRCLALVALAIASCSAQPLVGGQEGSSYPGSCPVDKWNDVVVTVVATQPESTTGPISIAYTSATNYPYGNPVVGFTTSPTWNQFLNNTAAFFSAPAGGNHMSATGLKFFGECKQNLLTLQATCSFVFDYSTRRLLDLLSKASPAGGIPLGGTVTFSFCTLALGQSEVSSTTCFESRGGTPKPVIVKITSKSRLRNLTGLKPITQEPSDVIPQIGFNACYNDAVGSPNKCLAFAIIQSCAASQQVGYGEGSSAHGFAATTYAAVAPAVAALPEGVSDLDSAAPAPANVATSFAAGGPLEAQEAEAMAMAAHKLSHKKAHKKGKHAHKKGAKTKEAKATKLAKREKKEEERAAGPASAEAAGAGSFTGRKLMD